MAPTPNDHSKLQSTVNTVDVLVEDEEEENLKDPDEKDILSGMKLFLAFVAMMLSLFLVALDTVSRGLWFFIIHMKPISSPFFSHFQTIVGA